MSIQEQFSNAIPGTKSFRQALDYLPGAIEFVPQSAGIRAGSDDWAAKSGKRLLDLGIAVPVLLIALPLLVLLGVVVRLETPGPALFRQKRIGHLGRPFDILKLRTMNVQENGDTVLQARPNDTRTTRIGRWLRATSLDELPQLINVIKGEMSLVGPRPHAQAHDTHYANLIPGYGRRQRVKPGITGWAQVSGLRGPTPTVDVMSERIAHDLWYVKHASLALDLKILLRTPLEVIRRRSAY